jgi:hypothetical protein
MGRSVPGVWSPVRGQPPDGARDHAGATAPRVRAAAHAGPDASGSPGCQVPMVLGASTGVRRPQGAITRDGLPRAGGAMGRTDPQRRVVGPETPVVPTDDTSWDGGRPACPPEGVRDQYDDRRSIRSGVALATTKSRRSSRNVKF